MAPPYGRFGPAVKGLRGCFSAARGHRVVLVDNVAGGMNGVLVDAAGLLHGAACWRADGAPIGLSGGPARPAAEIGIPM